MSKINKDHVGTSFDDFLTENKMLDEVATLSNKHIIAMQIKAAMEEKHISKTEMAKRMHTSRSAVDRLLNPNNLNITIDTIDRACNALGMKLNIYLI
jgi:antitoxin HicB